ncbi:MAG: VanZ family protein [Lachnospiraceae bacterium]|nr:VanZ family protein [Lachnospiraceae bacterium]
MQFFCLFFKKLMRYLLKPLSFLPALFMMYLIFFYSGQQGAVSSQVSQLFTTKLLGLLDRILNLELDSAQIIYYTELLHGLVRKLAHISEYFLLAVSVALPLYVYRLRGFWLVIISGIFCIGFACLDEYRQTFIPGRNGSKRDVLIDCIGIIPGIYLTRIFGWLGRMTIFKPLSFSDR